MNIDQNIDLIKRMRTTLEATHAQDALIAGFDAVALVKLRIQSSGTNSDNQQFEPYVPTYAKQRQKSGYQTSYVDFTRTGEMWANIKPRIILNQNNQVQVQVNADRQSELDKLRGQTKKRGNILELTEQEKADLSRTYRERRQKRINEIQ